MSNFDVSLSRARALLQRHAFADAEREYVHAIALRPFDLDAQVSLAKLRYMRGDPKFARDLAAQAAARNDPNVQLQFADVLRLTGDLDGAELLLRDLAARGTATPELHRALAAVLHDAGRLQEALTEAIAAVRLRPEAADLTENLVSVLLSLGRADQAMPLIRAERERQPRDHIWIAHEAIAARLTQDPAYERLYDFEHFVRVYDLPPPPGWSTMTEFNAALALALEALHTLERPPFNQSMRSGTQTIGSLVDATDPSIQAALSAFREPLAEYRAALGDSRKHPLTAGNRGTASFSGCWSVQLKAQGFHVNHIHPTGWLSSAYYVSVPAETDDTAQRSGWIQFGAPRMPVPGAEPALSIQPRPGRLVLFPSYMWHGTTPIHGSAARLTMAFDVVTDG